MSKTKRTTLKEIMNKTIKLEVSERIIALGMLRQWKGNLEDLAIVQEDLKQFPFTEKEKEELGIVEKEGSIQWRPDAPAKDFNISKTSVDFLVEKIKELSDKKLLSLADSPVVSLFGKLESK